MPYFDVPLATQQINNSQPQIRSNFTSIQADFSIDHVAISAAANNGKHNKVTFPNNAIPAAFLAGEIGLYNNGTELFVRKNAVANGIPMTQKAFNAGVNGYTWLPSGLLMKFGQATTNGAGQAIVVMNGIGTNYNQAPFIQLTIQAIGPNTIFLGAYNITQAQFQVNSVIPNVTFYWFAISPTAITP